MYVKKDKDKNKKKFKSNRKDRTCYNKSFILHQHLFCRSWRQQISNRNNKLNKWLLIVAPILTVLLVGYYLLRKSASDEMDSKRWDTRIKIALICCIGVVVASGLITIIIGYYK